MLTVKQTKPVHVLNPSIHAVHDIEVKRSIAYEEGKFCSRTIIFYGCDGSRYEIEAFADSDYLPVKVDE